MLFAGLTVTKELTSAPYTISKCARSKHEFGSTTPFFAGAARRQESVLDGELVERDFVVRLVERVVDDPGRDDVDDGLRGIGGDRDDLFHEVQVKRRPAPRLPQVTLHAFMDARIEARHAAH